MKAKDLISILNTVDPESDVWFRLGESQDQDYRNKCAMAEILEGECLEYINEVKKAEIEEIDGKLQLSIILKQNNYLNLDWVEEKFNETYKFIE